MRAIQLSDQRTGSRQQSRLKMAFPVFFAVLPAIIFYTILFRTVVNIPFHDDYLALLNFMNHWIPLTGFHARISYFLAAQHNEYKLFFEHSIACLQFDLTGHIDFACLCAIGNGFVLLLAFLLWKMFLPSHKDFATRLALFMPVSWLLFQLQYYETLNWAMAGLQNLPILVFSLGAIYFLVRSAPWEFSAAVVFFVLAVASSGNGFLLIPIGLLVLFLGRRFVRAAIWTIVSIACVAIYSYRYNIMLSQASAHRPFFLTLLRLRPDYVIAFIGRAFCLNIVAASLVLGTILSLFFTWMAYRGFFRRNPLISYCVLFLLLTAVGVAGIRSDFGVAHSLVPRYAIYSDLLWIFAWFMIVEEFLQHSRKPLLKNPLYLSSVTSAVLFCLLMDGVGLLLLQTRSRSLVERMALYEHAASIGHTETPDIERPDDDAERIAFRPLARKILTESIRLGVYRPSAY